jgi:iron complex outermembrane receptor protein
VVTAQKRAESVQSVPISIAAFGEAQLRQSGVDDISELARITPSFTSTRQLQIASVRINVRGVGASASTAVEPSVATFQDDIYVPRPGPLIGRFYDVETVEVLRGPQGTLFGRNASVGALSIHTRKPTNEFSLDASAQVASFDTYDATTAINLPFSDKAQFRLAGMVSSYGGFARTRVGNHRFGGTDTIAARATLKLEPLDNVTWLLRGDFSTNTGDGGANIEFKPDTFTATALANFQTRLGGIALDLNPFDRVNSNAINNNLDDRQFGLTSDLSYETSGGLTFRLINAYRSWKNDQIDSDLAALPIQTVARNSAYRSNSQTHELQLISPSDTYLGGKLDFVGGLYYFQEDFRIGERFSFTNDFCNVVVRLASAALQPACLSSPLFDASTAQFRQDLNSFAAYLQATYALTPTVDLTLGGRYTHDDKDGSFVQRIANPAARLLRGAESSDLAFKDGRFTWRANLSWKPVRDVMLYANYSTGFKSGGFNSGGGTVALGDARVFGSELVDDYEAGFKSQWGGFLTLNANAFRMDISDYQDRGFDGVTTTVKNVGSLRQQGVEAEATLIPARGFRINGAVAYLDSEFLSYRNAAGLPGFGGTQDLTGKRNNYSPKWQGSAGAEYNVDLTASGWTASLRGDMSFISDTSLNADSNANPQAIQKGYSLLGARLTISAPDDRYSISVFGENLTDKGYCTYIFPQVLDGVFGLRDRNTGGTVYRCAVGTPRTIGARFGLKF